MGLFRWLFDKKRSTKEETEKKESEEQEKRKQNGQTKEKEEIEWATIPNYIEVDEKERELVLLIATAVAAGDRPDSQFKIKKIMKVNPKVRFISAITAAAAADDKSDSQFIVKSVKVRKQ